MVKGEGESSELKRSINIAVKKVGEDYERMKFNTAIAAMMSLVNDFYANGSVTRDELHTLLLLLSPAAPHICEEMNAELGYEPLHHSAWPKYDPNALAAATTEYGIQINGKVRARIALPADTDRSEVEKAAIACPDIKMFMEGKTIRKVIVVKNIVNIVIA